MAVTASQYINKIGEGCRSGTPVAASTTLYGGTMAFVNASGYADDDVASGVNIFRGIVVETVDNSAGSNGTEKGEFWSSGRFLLTGSGFAQTSVGKRVYATDNFTLTLVATGGVYVGVIDEYVSATQVWVQIHGNTPYSAVDTNYIPDAVAQSLSGAGAINVTTFLTKWTTTAADAGTLADGTRIGQLKKIQLIVDGGDGTLTPSNLANGTTITFADAGDFALLRWNGTDWRAIELGNDADGATAPVLA